MIPDIWTSDNNRVMISDIMAVRKPQAQHIKQAAIPFIVIRIALELRKLYYCESIELSVVVTGTAFSPPGRLSKQNLFCQFRFLNIKT